MSEWEAPKIDEESTTRVYTSADRPEPPAEGFTFGDIWVQLGARPRPGVSKRHRRMYQVETTLNVYMWDGEDFAPVKVNLEGTEVPNNAR